MVPEVVVTSTPRTTKPSSHPTHCFGPERRRQQPWSLAAQQDGSRWPEICVSESCWTPGKLSYDEDLKKKWESACSHKPGSLLCGWLSCPTNTSVAHPLQTHWQNMTESTDTNNFGDTGDSDEGGGHILWDPKFTQTLNGLFSWHQCQ